MTDQHQHQHKLGECGRLSPAETRRLLSRRGFLAATGGVAGAFALGGTAAAAPAQATTPPPIGKLGGSRLRLHILSDVHISDVYPMTMNDMRTMLQDLHSVFPDPDAMVIIGDLTEFGQVQDYPLNHLALQTSPHPDRVLLAIGNHEYMSNTSPVAPTHESVEELQKRFLDYVGRDSLYYTDHVGGYPFIILGGESAGPNPPIVLEPQLDWLESQLEEYARPGRPTFVFLHQPPEITNNPARFTTLLKSYPNVILFWGHYHVDLSWHLRGPDPTLLGNNEGYWRIQCPATTYCWYYDSTSGKFTQTFMADWKQALAVEVFDHGVRVRGRDGYTNSWINGFDQVIPIV
ncbi:MAG: metallophosphoesterase [Mycobacterium sp.]|nr:metallophosphoesterase [Mycobacterium sp.]